MVRAKLGSSEWGRLTAKQLTLQGTLRELQDALATAEDAVTQHSDEIARLQGSMAGGDAARAGEEARLAAALAEARASADAAAATAQEASCDARQAAELLAEKQGVLSQSDGELRALCEARDAAAKAAAAAARAVKKLSSTLASHKSAVADAKRRVAHLLSAHAWIAQDKAYFGKPGSDFDFEAVEPEAAASRLAELEAAQESLGAGLNKKVLGMMESAEREYAALMDKKRIVENDKAKIQRVICELDEKKAEALAKTWAQVNTDFGSIFSTLLPGVSAQLAPPEGADLADGLEVRVAFGSVWKESLTELSGGQRSLLALSLILALLRFKPAPLYILDEFVDGSSAVTRTVPAGASSHSAAAAGAAAVAPPAGDENIGAGAAAGSKRAGARGRSSRAILA
ncbi:smc2 [Symbiodinium sp. KB8]|nr:smc2 [Symbiodinium sp. KB8]